MCIKLHGVWYYLEVCLNACSELSFVKLQDKLVEGAICSDVKFRQTNE